MVGDGAARRRRRARLDRAPPLASGLLLGLAILTRETVLYFLPLAALWLAWRRAGGARRAARAPRRVALLVVLPWTVRNWLVFDAFVPVSTSGALNLWQGNTRLSRQEVYEEYWAVHGRIAKYEHARRRAIEAILERQPLWIFEKLRDEMPAFWAAHGQPIVHLERGAYGAVARPRALAAVAVVLLPYLAVLVLFVAGVATLPRGRAPLLLLAFLVFYVLLHVAAHGYPRYRLPAMPAVFLVAAHGLVRVARPRGPSTARTAWPRPPPPSCSRSPSGPSLVAWVDPAVAAALVRGRRGRGRRGGAGARGERRSGEAVRPSRAIPLALLLAIVVRLPFWIEALRTPVDGDTAIVGLMARHPGVGTTFWGQPYGSPLDSWVALPFVAAWGSHHGGAAPAVLPARPRCSCRSPTPWRASSIPSAGAAGRRARRLPAAVLPAPRRAAAALLPDDARPVRARPPAAARAGRRLEERGGTPRRAARS